MFFLSDIFYRSFSGLVCLYLYKCTTFMSRQSVHFVDNRISFANIHIRYVGNIIYIAMLLGN